MEIEGGVLGERHGERRSNRLSERGLCGKPFVKLILDSRRPISWAAGSDKWLGWNQKKCHN